MPSFQAKDSQVLSRELKVQRLVIPFSIVGNSTSVSVVSSNDEPALMFIATQGVDNITPALASGETATYSVSPLDGSGQFNVLIKISETLVKVLRCGMSIPSSGATGNSAKLGSATAITTGTAGGQSIMLTCVSSVALNASSTLNGCLDVEYVVQK